jgi:FkbM family methyltransferase
MIFTRIIRLIPGQVLEYAYYSKIGKTLTTIYDHIYKKETLKTYKISDDLLMNIDLSKPAERAIVFEAFEPKITKKFLDLVEEGGVVFDVGAWIGYYTLLAARKAGKIISIDADQENCKRIKMNADLMHLSNILIFNIAVGNRPSKAFLLDGPSSAMHRVVSEGRGKSVEVETLDTIIEDLKIHKINVLIMDIEGYEFFALKGLQNSLSAAIIQNLICEVHPKMLKENGISENDIQDLLSQCRYQVTQLHKITEFEPYHIYAKPIDH